MTIRLATNQDQPIIRKIYLDTAGHNQHFEDDYERIFADGGIVVALADEEILLPRPGGLRRCAHRWRDFRSSGIGMPGTILRPR
jgi:hypothetical protein